MTRIIPRLDIKGPNLVKGIHLEGLRVLGRPEDFARHYYKEGADELLYMDVVASLYGRNSLLDMVERTSREIFIPLCVGGGLRSLDDIRAVLRAGADKVALNTAVIRRPAFIREAAATFGSSTVVVSIEAMKGTSGEYQCFTDNGREPTGRDALLWAKEVAELGAGELLVTSIDKEGTGQGFDVDLLRKISSAVSIPVVACGGAGRPQHILDAIRRGGADAACMASLVHYDAIQRGICAERNTEGNVDYLTGGARFTLVEAASIPDIKRDLAEAGVDVRRTRMGIQNG